MTEYYRRALTCLEHVKRAAPDPHWDGILVDAMALGRVVLALGVRDGARREFWRYMRRVCAEHGDRFSEAVRLAAMGYHFRKLTAVYCGET